MLFLLRTSRTGCGSFLAVVIASTWILSGCGAGAKEEKAKPIQTEQVQPGKYSSVPVGESCQSSDPKNYCLGLKYVVYQNSRGVPVTSRAQALENVSDINVIWKQCRIGFQMDEFLEVKPRDYHLDFNTVDMDDLTKIRRKFEDSVTLLVVTTGEWDRDGTLGDTAANAWTAMPGEGPVGVILESPVGTIANIIAHELGHYLGLDHEYDSDNLMNAIIYGSSTDLLSNQCQEARSSIRTYWEKMKR